MCPNTVREPFLGEKIMSSQMAKVLKEAVQLEEESFRLYTNAQAKAKLESSKNFLEELAETEMEHKRKLTEIMNDKKSVRSLGGQKGEMSEDLGIVDYMKDVKAVSEDADYMEILVYAAQREKKTHDYYALLSKKLQGTVGKLFQRLAGEELKHKIRLEKEYDDMLKEN